MPKEKLVESITKSLQKDYVLIGKGRIFSWHAWLVIGMTIGLASGIFLVANRSGEFETSSAHSDSSASTTVTVSSPNGGERLLIGSRTRMSWRVRGKIPKNARQTIVLFRESSPSNVFELKTSDADNGINNLNWMVRETQAFPPAVDYKIRVTISAPSSSRRNSPRTLLATDESDATFTIASEILPPPPPPPATIPGSVIISLSTFPISQNIIAGSANVNLAKINFDSANSSEGVRINALKFRLETDIGESMPTNCRLYSGVTLMNSGAVVNPIGDGVYTFTLDGPGFVIAKDTVIPIDLNCDIRSGEPNGNTIEWRLDASDIMQAIGDVSGSPATVQVQMSPDNQNKMTIISGGMLFVTLDSASPAYRVFSAGSLNVELARIRFTASNEDIDLRQVALQLSGTDLNTPDDLVNREVTLWTTDGVQVATAQFSISQGDFATSSAIATGAFRVMKDTSKVLVIKGNLSNICISCDISTSGDFVRVDYDGGNVGINGNYGVGVSSGANISPTASDTASEGVRIFKAFPSFSAVTGWQPATLSNGDQPLFRFSVRANGGDVGVYKFTVRTNVTSVNVSEINIFGYTESSFSSPVAGANTAAGQLNGTNGVWVDASTDINFTVQDSSATDKVLTIPSGSTYYFELRGTVAGADASGDSISTQIQGDASSFVGMGQALSAESFIDNDFIWTPNSLGASALTSIDFTNGYSLPGLPTSNMSPQVLSR